MTTKRDRFAAVEARGASGDDAARAALRSRTGRPTSLRLGELQPNPDNPRYDADDPETIELAETMRSVGQLQPAIVVPRQDYLACYPRAQLGPAPWVVVIGNRRLAAARIANREALDVRVAVDIQSADDLEDRILIENIQRKDLPPLLEAERLQRRLDQGVTFRDLAAKIGKSHTYVKQRVDLLKLIPELQKLFRAGQIRVKGARWLGAQPEEIQRSILAAGGPYDEPARSAASGAAVNPVSTPAASEHDETDGSSPAPGNQPPADKPSSSAGDTSPREDGATAHPTGQPQPRPANGEAASGGAASGGGHTDEQRPATGTDLLLNTRASVTQWLDNALGDLDGALPAGGDGGLGSAMSRARQLIQDARDTLHEL